LKGANLVSFPRQLECRAEGITLSRSISKTKFIQRLQQLFDKRCAPLRQIDNALIALARRVSVIGLRANIPQNIAQVDIDDAQRCHFIEVSVAVTSGFVYLPGCRSELRPEVDDLEDIGG
jgi:hypothetical protein